MAVKQRNKRTKQHSNGSNSAAKLKSKDDSKATNKEDTGVHDKSKSTTNSGNLFQNPFFVTGFLTVILMLSVAVYLSQVDTRSRVVIVTKVQEEGSQQEYQHSIDKIDRRSDLSLEEYRRVYDGKWYVCHILVMFIIVHIVFSKKIVRVLCFTYLLLWHFFFFFF